MQNKDQGTRLFRVKRRDDTAIELPAHIAGSVIAKITERIVQRQLHYYLSSNCLLSDSQHGFRPNHSTASALIRISDSILSAMDNSEISLLCLIDLSIDLFNTGLCTEIGQLP